jgi:hypothetical protein
LTVQIVVAFAAETHEQECLVDLQEEAARLGEKEVHIPFVVVVPQEAI